MNNQCDFSSDSIPIDSGAHPARARSCLLTPMGTYRSEGSGSASRDVAGCGGTGRVVSPSPPPCQKSQNKQRPKKKKKKVLRLTVAYVRLTSALAQGRGGKKWKKNGKTSNGKTSRLWVSHGQDKG